jgi:hypothetical protein
MEAIDVKIDAEKRFAVCVDFGGVLHCRTMLVTIEAAEVVQQ